MQHNLQSTHLINTTYFKRRFLSKYILGCQEIGHHKYYIIILTIYPTSE